MGIRRAVAQAASAVSTAALKYVFRRPAANFPGKAALVIDPKIIAELAPKMNRGSICVVGTNGKTTVTNMLADTLQSSGYRVVCNRTGANLDSGVATSLLHAGQSDWGVFECDELWLARILPHLQSRFVVLLNLFRDQLDRVGDVEYIQDSIASALKASPDTVVIYNADDPFCERIVRDVPNPTVPFGIGEDMGLGCDGSSDARMCQRCEGMLEYDYRSYNQLGRFHCTACDFRRAPLRFSARNCSVTADGLAFDVVAAVDEQAVGGGKVAHIEAPYAGVYMVYNLLALYAAAHQAGAPDESIARTIAAYDPQNGRLQTLQVNGREVLINLAKNPTGFNQNLAMMTTDESPVAAAFFVNDAEGDGRDISWLWDIDFESIAALPGLAVYAGGARRNDLQVRLKYAGIDAQLVDDAPDCMARIGALDDGYHVYMVANYTSLPAVREDLVRLAQGQGGVAAPPLRTTRAAVQEPPAPSDLLPADQPLRIVHLLPDLLNLYGDAGNIRVLVRRCEWRGIPVSVSDVAYGTDPAQAAEQVSHADIVFVGSGPDREQGLACRYLHDLRDALASHIEGDGVVLAVCGGLQLLGASWCSEGKEVPGLGLLDMTTACAADASRTVGDIVLRTSVATAPVVGYLNHAGTTTLGQGLQPFGTAVGGNAPGASSPDASDGVLYRNVLATNAHGPLLSKGPQVADWLLERALQQRVGSPCELPALDDSVEQQAAAFMLQRLGVA